MMTDRDRRHLHCFLSEIRDAAYGIEVLGMLTEELTADPDNENGYRVGGLCYATMALGKYINGMTDDLMTTFGKREDV